MSRVRDDCRLTLGGRDQCNLIEVSSKQLAHVTTCQQLSSMQIPTVNWLAHLSHPAVKVEDN